MLMPPSSFPLNKSTETCNYIFEQFQIFHNITLGNEKLAKPSTGQLHKIKTCKIDNFFLLTILAFNNFLEK